MQKYDCGDITTAKGGPTWKSNPEVLIVMTISCGDDLLYLSRPLSGNTDAKEWNRASMPKQ